MIGSLHYKSRKWSLAITDVSQSVASVMLHPSPYVFSLPRRRCSDQGSFSAHSTVDLTLRE